MAKCTIEEVLKKRKLSKRQFAKRLGLPYNAVFRYFKEGYDPKLSTLAKWAKAIPCKITDLFKE
jgi:DNA-binding XRE family transcriptional regulator